MNTSREGNLKEIRGRALETQEERQENDGVRALSDQGWQGLVEASAPARGVEGVTTPALPTPICSQMAGKSVQFLHMEKWSKELLSALTKPDQTHQEQPPEKVDHPLYPPPPQAAPVPTTQSQGLCP